MEIYNDIDVSMEDKRQYRGLVLENGLKVLLVSDPTTDKSAASLDVHIGHLSDPPDLRSAPRLCPNVAHRSRLRPAAVDLRLHQSG